MVNNSIQESDLDLTWNYKSGDKTNNIHRRTANLEEDYQLVETSYKSLVFVNPHPILKVTNIINIFQSKMETTHHRVGEWERERERGMAVESKMEEGLTVREGMTRPR